MRLDSASQYPWQNIRRGDLPRQPGGGRRLHWFVLVSCICSLLLHLLLILLFSDIRIALPSLADKDPIAFRIPRLEVNEASLRPRPDTDTPSKLSPESFPELLEEKQLDLTDIQARIPDDREIAITPEVRKPENIAPGGAAAAGLPLETLDVQAFENSLETVSERSLKAPDFAPVASENQPLLAAEPEGIASGKARDLLDKAARGNEGLSDRFSTLDDLLGIPGGKLTDITKPIYMPSDLLFDFNEDRLRDSAKTSLMMLGILIDRNPDTIFVIEGHTDTIGTEERNLSLSNRRASAVATWLQQSLRIPAERVRIEGFGESQPLVAPGGTVEEQQPNRRVEIRMLRPGKPATGSGPTRAPAAAAFIPPAEPAAPPALAPAVRVAPAIPVEEPAEPVVRPARVIEP